MPNFRSKFEENMSKNILAHCEYEPFKIEYPVDVVKTYTPDFVDQKRKIMWECKGHFRMRHDATKYLYIVPAAVKEGWRFIFAFQAPYTAMPGVRKRTNGTKQSMAEWADKQGFEWYPAGNIPKELIS